MFGDWFGYVIMFIGAVLGSIAFYYKFTHTVYINPTPAGLFTEWAFFCAIGIGVSMLVIGYALSFIMEHWIISSIVVLLIVGALLGGSDNKKDEGSSDSNETATTNEENKPEE